MPEYSHEEAARIAAEILGQYMVDWSPEDVAEALSDLESVTVYLPRPLDLGSPGDFGVMNCPSCGEVTSIREIRITTSEHADSYALECDECGAVWSP